MRREEPIPRCVWQTLWPASSGLAQSGRSPEATALLKRAQTGVVSGGRRWSQLGGATGTRPPMPRSGDWRQKRAGTQNGAGQSWPPARGEHGEKAVNRSISPEMRGNAIAARHAGRRRRSGGGGSRRRSTGRRRRARRNGGSKAGGIGSAFAIAKQGPGKAVGGAARVIPKKFFRGMLRSARLLRGDRTAGAVAVTTVQLAGVPACDGARVGTRAA